MRSEERDAKSEGKRVKNAFPVRSLSAVGSNPMQVRPPPAVASGWTLGFSLSSLPPPEMLPLISSLSSLLSLWCSLSWSGLRRLPPCSHPAVPETLAEGRNLSLIHTSL